MENLPGSVSSSEDDLERFKESIDQQFLKETLYSSNPTKCCEGKDKEVKQPSLRRNINEEDESLNIFRVTPTFQKYVAKHLAAKLEEELREQEIDVKLDKPSNYKNNTVRGGIKLLWSSSHHLKVHKVAEEDKKQEIKTRPKLNVDFDEALLEEQCNQVSVNSIDIIRQKDTQFWSNRSKAPVFSYKVKNGLLEFQAKPFISYSYKNK